MDAEITVVADPAALLADTALVERVNLLGKQSAIAQQLKVPITSAALFAQHAAPQHQQLLLATVNDQVVGFLKSGFKHLYYMDHKGVYTELDPLCVLDFYVLEDCQRLGIGAQLFSQLLTTHHVKAAQIAYDRPSPKLLAFLEKHAQLVHFIPQPNNFVIFDDNFLPAA